MKPSNTDCITLEKLRQQKAEVLHQIQQEKEQINVCLTQITAPMQQLTSKPNTTASLLFPRLSYAWHIGKGIYKIIRILRG